MGVVVVCSALLAAGIVVALRWSGLGVRVPEIPDQPSVGDAVRRYVWSLALVTWTALITGMLVAGPGGRLAMRILAVTAGEQAQGRLTEADQIVGRISVDGTIGLFIFGGLFAGFIASVLYMALRRWLPSGRMSGLALGALLLVAFATRIEPLRAGNPDFDIVGPGWLSLTIFVLLGLLEGLAVVAVAGRLSRMFPVIGHSPRSIAPYLVLAVLAPGTIFTVGGALIVGLISVAASMAGWRQVLESRRAVLAGRVVLGVGALVALPGFVRATVDILGRGP